MALGNSRKTHIDSPVTLVLAALSTAVFLADLLFAVPLSQSVFSCPGSLASPAFNFASPFHYVRIIIWPLGFRTPCSFFACLIFVLLLSPQVENRWGSSVFALMLLASTLVGGAFTAAFSPASLSGLQAVVFMALILVAVDKKTLPASHIAAFLSFACFEFFSQHGSQDIPFWQGRIPFFIELAAALAGSLYGFFCVPKKKTAARKKTAVPRKRKPSTKVDVTIEGYGTDETAVYDTPPVS